MNFNPWYSTVSDYANWIFDGSFIGLDTIYPRTRYDAMCSVKSHIGDAFDEEIFNKAWESLIANGKLRKRKRIGYNSVCDPSSDEAPQPPVYEPVYEQRLEGGKLKAVLCESGANSSELVLDEGKNTRGKRDGTGPYKNSYQVKISKNGKRKKAGKTCPNEDKDRIPLEDFLDEEELINERPVNLARMVHKASTLVCDNCGWKWKVVIGQGSKHNPKCPKCGSDDVFGAGPWRMNKDTYKKFKDQWRENNKINKSSGKARIAALKKLWHNRPWKVEHSIDLFSPGMYEAVLTMKKRARLPKRAFAGPDRSYPVHDKKHVMAAIAYAKKYWNATGEARSKARAAWGNIVSAAKKFGIKIHGKPGK